jgi:hypothetical protein
MPSVIDARPTVVNLKVYAGDDLYLQVTVVDIDGQAEDLTGTIAQAQIRTTTDDDIVLAEFETTVTSTAIYLHLTAIDTAALAGVLPDGGVWDVQLTYPDTTVATVARGSVQITSEVTR